MRGRRADRTLTVALVLLPLAVYLAVSLALGRAESGDATDVALSGTPEQRAIAYLSAQRTAQHLPGVELAVVRDGHVTTWAAGRAAPGVALTPHTPLLLASLTKSLTAVAVLQLVAAGSLDLEAPVTTYLPWFRTADRAASDAITVDQLLHHLSGLDDAAVDTAGRLGDTSAAALERGVRAMAHSALVASPGRAFHYANANYDVLGLLVQQVSGQPYADYLTEHVLRPLGMTDAWASPAAARAHGGTAGFYRWLGLVYRPARVPLPGFQAPAALVSASAADVARLLQAQLDGGRVDDRLALAAAVVRGVQAVGAPANPFTGYAGGWFVRPLWEALRPGRLTGAAVGLPLVYEHQGDWSTTTTFAGFVPRLHLGAAVLIDSHDPSAASRQYALQSQLWRVLLGHSPQPLGAATETRLEHDGPAVALALLAGQLALLVASVRTVVRRRRLPSWRRWAVLLGALLVEAVAMGFLWLYVPRAVDQPARAIIRYRPDLGAAFVVLTVLVVGWAPVRTLLLARPQPSALE